MRIYKKIIILDKPKKVLGARTIFPITYGGQIVVDNSLFSKDWCLEEIILVVKVREKKYGK